MRILNVECATQHGIREWLKYKNTSANKTPKVKKYPIKVIIVQIGTKKGGMW